MFCDSFDPQRYKIAACFNFYYFCRKFQTRKNMFEDEDFEDYFEEEQENHL